MKYFLKTSILATLIVVSFNSNAQLGKLKNIKQNAQAKMSNNDEDFSELETKKMSWTSTFERLEKKWDQISFEEYEAKKAEYAEFYEKFRKAYKADRKKEHDDSYTQKIIDNVDIYYQNSIPDTEFSEIKNTAKPSFDEENWTVYPSDRIRDIEKAQKQINEARAYLKQPDSELEEYENSLVKQKEKIIKYVNEGGLEKRDAEIEKRMVEKRFLHKERMKDPSVNALVNSKIDQEKYGKPLRVIITSEIWYVERNKQGQPKLKNVAVDIATKKPDGKCYYVRGEVSKLHEGGGVYGDQYLEILYIDGEMNCENVNK